MIASYTVSKRIFDAVASCIALLVLGPLLLLILLLVRFTSSGPAFFRQVRPGLLGRPFTLIKYRTMVDRHDFQGTSPPDADRITRFGRFLRSTSLDELPELFNVLKGDMSIVGPRPLLMQYMERYTPEQARRHEVKPGITGWAQVNGRNALTWEEKFELDVWYVDNRSFGLDLKIIGLTIRKIIKREGINQPGHVTAREFTGSVGQASSKS